MNYTEQNYKGRAIMWDDLLNCWTVLYCGDEVIFSTPEEARAFIDEVY